jgi:hypothetical protein
MCRPDSRTHYLALSAAAAAAATKQLQVQDHPEPAACAVHADEVNGAVE